MASALLIHSTTPITLFCWHRLYSLSILPASCLYLLKMEEFYDSSKGSIEAYLDDAAFELLTLDLPTWFINDDIKGAFSQRSAWDNVVR
ncbi:hypothetical protein DM02DRAFT_612572 [Periconia macrospinosa]|uniref:Uncharacterized protein n=1 Tax=Periconia macrospinosa TaxID=97972 RepID=A0A2V1DXM2_9PLEO|nr:hypothetical protein DM02DRAFT_612572 [Periconia macrospinosa]